MAQRLFLNLEYQGIVRSGRSGEKTCASHKIVPDAAWYYLYCSIVRDPSLPVQRNAVASQGYLKGCSGAFQ